MVGWHHQLNGHESEQTVGDSEGREPWCASVRRVSKSRTLLRTVQQQHVEQGASI